MVLLLNIAAELDINIIEKIKTVNYLKGWSYHSYRVYNFWLGLAIVFLCMVGGLHLGEGKILSVYACAALIGHIVLKSYIYYLMVGARPTIQD